MRIHGRRKRTGINIGDDNLGALIGKQLRGFSTDTLTRAGDDGDLAREETAGVVEVGVHLGEALRHDCILERVM